VAVDYARELENDLAGNPTDRAVLRRFVAAVTGDVLDVGCGPGRITGHLHDAGLRVRGVDLSPAMVAEARRRHPAIDFAVGSMTALDQPDRSVGGAVAWYSIIHLPPADLIRAFAEFARVLVPGGLLQLAFQTGDAPVHVRRAYGHELSLLAYRLDPDAIGGELRAAGFTTLVRQVRGPMPGEKTPQAFLLARRTPLG
jgi:ubiquinone/menaquinone biosynthesis C-methylase UbiE